MRLFPWIKEYRTGWLPNAIDERDWDFASSPMCTVGPLPLQVNLFSLVREVLYQGNAPSCVGSAIAHQIMIEEVCTRVRNSIPSRAYIYAMSRAQHQKDLRLSGTFPRLAYRGVQKLGCPAEKYWPYSTKASVLNQFPPERARRNAFGRYGLKYYSILRNRSARIRQALAGNHPVCFGTQVTEELKRYKEGTVLGAPAPWEQLIGGHYMCIVGYRGDYFIVLNSWKGKEKILMHESYIEWDKSSDFTAITGWNYLKG